MPYTAIRPSTVPMENFAWHGLRLDHPAEHVDGALVDPRGDRGDLRVIEPFALHQRQQRVGRGMGMAARGVELERGFQQRPAAAEAIHQALGVGVAGHPGGHPLLAFEDVSRAAQAVGGEIGGEQPVGGGLGGMQLLGIGGVAEELPEPGGLGSGAAEQVDEALAVEVHQLAHRHCRGEGADRGSGMEHPVVGTAEEFADADAGLVAGHRREDQLGAAAAEVLGRGQGSREDHRRGVQHRAVVQVVLLHHVGSRAVHQGGEIRRAAPPAGQDLRATVGRAHAFGVALEQWDRMLALPASAEPSQSRNNSSIRANTAGGRSW